MKILKALINKLFFWRKSKPQKLAEEMTKYVRSDWEAPKPDNIYTFEQIVLAKHGDFEIDAFFEIYSYGDYKKYRASGQKLPEWIKNNPLTTQKPVV